MMDSILGIALSLALAEVAFADLRLETSSFQINLGKSTGQLSVVEKRTGKPILTPSAKPIIQAQVGLIRSIEHNGFFNIAFKDQTSCRESYFSRAELIDEKRFTIFGDFRDCEISYKINFEEVSSKQFSIDGRVTKDSPLNPSRLVLSYAAKKDESYWGFGTQVSHLDLRGQRVPIIAQEQGYGRGDFNVLIDSVAKGAGKAGLFPGVLGHSTTNHLPVPFYMSSEMLASFFKQHSYIVYDLRKDDETKIEIYDDRFSWHWINGNEPKDLIETYTLYSGRMKALPDWTQVGMIVDARGGADKIRAIIKKLKSFDLNLAGILIQDWSGVVKSAIGSLVRWIWDVDHERYPSLEEFSEELKNDGIRTLTYINPYIWHPKNPKQVSHLAEIKDFLVRGHDGAPLVLFGPPLVYASPIDLFKEEGRQWLTNKIEKQIVTRNHSGWMADFGEHYPVLKSRKPVVHLKEFKQHQEFAGLWNQVNYDALQRGGDSEQIFFARTGTATSPGKMSILWLADQNATWGENDGIKSALVGMLSAGVSGFSLVHSDTGGYLGVIGMFKRSSELLKRWGEMNAYTVMFRTHEGASWDRHHQVYSSDDTAAFFAALSKIFQGLAPYRKLLMQEAEQKGYPVVRPLYFHYHDDQIARKIDDQFLLGDALLVAPVLKPKTKRKRAYLPKGKWLHPWTDQTFEVSVSGLWVEVEAPLGKTPIFINTNSPRSALVIDALRDRPLERTDVTTR